MKIAVLITCHNRREKTLRCLDSLYVQTNSATLKPEVWLVDDGSTDGTGEAVSQLFPAVRRIVGSGNLFWCGGMREAWSQAAKTKPDAFLWLNDDVVLNPDALETMQWIASKAPNAIVVGSCAQPGSNRRTYGGLRRVGRHPGKLYPVEPSAAPLTCDTFEGNLVWIPASVHAVVGNMAPFTHSMGDIDYGYRATEAGVPILVAPGTLGTCPPNPGSLKWRDRDLPRSERLKGLLGVKGLPPRDWWRFCRRHGGARAPLYFAAPFLRVLCGL